MLPASKVSLPHCVTSAPKLTVGEGLITISIASVPVPQLFVTVTEYVPEVDTIKV